METRRVTPSRVINKSDVTYGEPIGKGAFGTVFKVTLKTLEGPKEAAAKKVASSTQSEEELKFMSSLSHKNIISFYGFIREKSHLTIITELAEKGDLQSFLHSSNKPLPKELVKKWTREAAEGIHYLHQQKTVHKDVKSSNYLISSDDVLKLCDFGTVGDLDHTGKTEHRKGTVRWMAPEVIKQEVRSSKSDVFAYGIVTWEICTREVPFAKWQTRSDIMDAIVEGKRPKIPRNCPDVIRKIMESCWKEDHQERPSMDEVLDMIQSEKGSANDSSGDEDVDSDEDSDDGDLPEKFKYFEKRFDTSQKMVREEHIRGTGDKMKQLMDKVTMAKNTRTKALIYQAKTEILQMDKIKKTTGDVRVKLMKDKQALRDAEKDRRRQLMRRKADNIRKMAASRKGDAEYQKMVQLKNYYIEQDVEQMLRACYKSDDWEDDDLKSFTRGSTIHANVPDVIKDRQGVVTTYTEPQTTSDVFELDSIPSRGVLLGWKDEINARKEVGKKSYIEAEKGRFGLDTIDQIMIVHRVLDIRKQVKEELIWCKSPKIATYDTPGKRPEQLEGFENMVFNSKHDQVLEGYDMDPMMLSKICCDQALTYHHIQWFLTRLNHMQYDVFCLCPQFKDATDQNVAKLLQDGKQSPSSLVLIFSVRKVGEVVMLGTDANPGSHFSLCYVNSLTNTVLYADSLGWPAPAELRETVDSYYQSIYGHSAPDIDITFCHEPSSASADGTHTCCQHCATYYPLQTCDNVCGVVVIIIACVACLDKNLFLFLTTIQRYGNHPTMSHFCNPSDFAKFLRVVLAAWLQDKCIDMSLVTPENFAKYQLFNSIDPCVIAELDFHPLLKLVDSVPGLVDVLLPDDDKSKHGEPEDSNSSLDEQRNQRVSKTVRHWTGSKLDDISKEIIVNCTRIGTTRLRQPAISKVKADHVVLYEEVKPVTDVFQDTEIPDHQTLLLWKNQLLEASSSNAIGQQVYVEAGDERYDFDAVCGALKVHRICKTKALVQQELEWFADYQLRPLAAVKIPAETAITRFRHLIHDSKQDEIIANFDYNMNAEEMSLICCNRSLSGKHVQWIVRQMNSMQSNVICLFGNDGRKPSAAGNKPSTPPSSILMVFRICQSDGITHFSDTDRPGCHFTICYVDVHSKKIIYGDSYGWLAPEDLQDQISEQYKKVFNSTLPTMEIVLCHDTTLNPESDQHRCSPLCATYFPLQSSNTGSGVLCSILIAIACLAPSYFEFITEPQYNIQDTWSLGFHLQYPTLHSNYLRRVLAAWFAEGYIDIDNVVPTGFDRYNRLFVTGNHPVPTREQVEEVRKRREKAL